MKICIAGKNNIAVDCLEYAIKYVEKDEICVLLNKTDNCNNNWQKSLGFYANLYGIKILTLEDVIKINDIIFFSIEFDTIVKPFLFKTNKLFNIHFSLLPEYKGMFTSIFPILHGKTDSGVTFHKIDSGIDTGNIIDQIHFDINGFTSRTLYERKLKIGVELFEKHFETILSSKYFSFPQKSSNSTYYSKNSINFKDVDINIYSTAFQILNHVRAFNFRIYQTAKFNNRGVIKVVITETKSIHKPGTVIQHDFESIKVATIDFDVYLFYDFYDELINCCKFDLIDQAEKIIDFVVDINETSSNGWTPIIIAAYHGSLEVIKLFLNRGVDINSTNLNGTTVFMYACSNYDNHCNLVFIEYLLNMGANVWMKDIHGLNIFDYCKNNEILKLLNKFK